jgi:deaminated glutathione amidase
MWRAGKESMMRRARLAAAQITVRAGDKEHNLARLGQLTDEAAARAADLVCFPELCSTGFVRAGMAGLAECIPGPTTGAIAALAAKHHLWIAAGLAEAHPEGRQPYNSIVVIDAGGELRAVYRKLLLFPGEVGAFATGSHPCLVDLPYTRAGIVICYEYAFPAYVSGLVDRGAELILHPAAWVMTPTKARLRYDPDGFRAVGVARAVENTVWHLSANQYGVYDDAGEMEAVGRSAIIAPWAEVLAEVTAGEGLAIAEVDFDSADEWREKAAPYLVDRRRCDPWRQ